MRSIRPVLLPCTLAAALIATAGCDRQAGIGEDEPYGEATAPAAEEPATQADATSPPPAGGTATALDSRTFVEKAAADNLLEVRLGEVAQQKAQSPEVKQYAQTLMQDHQTANDQLVQAAQGLGLDVPQELPVDKQQVHDRLSALSGEEFDREYLRSMVEDHRKAVDMFRQASSDPAVAPELQQFASSTLPKLEQHLERAQQLESGAPSPSAP